MPHPDKSDVSGWGTEWVVMPHPTSPPGRWGEEGTQRTCGYNNQVGAAGAQLALSFDQLFLHKREQVSSLPVARNLLSAASCENSRSKEISDLLFRTRICFSRDGSRHLGQ